MSAEIRYLLDTNVLIDYSKSYEPARSLVMRLLESSDEVGVCSVVVAEFKAGIPSDDHERWDVFLRTLEYWDIPYSTVLRRSQENTGTCLHDKVVSFKLRTHSSLGWHLNLVQSS